MQEVPDNLGPGVLLGWWFRLGWRGLNIFDEDLRAVFLEALLNDAFGQALVHSSSTCRVLVPAMGFPPVVVSFPAFGALLHKVPFVLLGVLPLVSGSLLAYVVLRVVIDLGQPLHSMVVDVLAVIVQNLLPFFQFVVLELLGPFPGREGGIPLAAPELRLIAWGVGRPGGFADVEHSDALEVLFSDFQLYSWVGAKLPRLWPTGR